jgi:hypothetical protein
MNLSSDVPFLSPSIPPKTVENRFIISSSCYMLYYSFYYIIRCLKYFKKKDIPFRFFFTRALTFILRIVERTGRLLSSAHLRSITTCHACYTTVPILSASLINEYLKGGFPLEPVLPFLFLSC